MPAAYYPDNGLIIGPDTIRMRRTADADTDEPVLGGDTRAKLVADRLGNSTRTYNPDGSIATVTNVNGTRTFHYNVDGSIDHIIGTGIYPNEAYSYDGNGNLIGITVS